MFKICFLFIFGFLTGAAGPNVRPYRASTVAQNNVIPQAKVTSGLEVKSFREWKAEKIERVGERVLVIKEQIKSLKSQGKEDQSKNLTKDLTQEDWNLDVAKDLTVADYFVLYLSQHPSERRFQEAASKMSVTEVADLLEAYAKAIGVNRIEPQQNQGLSKTATSKPGYN
jgi:hypothetical protein